MIAEAPVTIEFDTIDDVLKDIAAGKLVIDDADRENEGDLVMAAEKATPKAINFMATPRRSKNWAKFIAHPSLNHSRRNPAAKSKNGR